MHFHLPKPLHGWREFAGEVGIIVIGVLIALGAEQVVSAARQRQDAAAADNIIRSELDLNLGRLKSRMGIYPCMDRRIEQIQAILNKAADNPDIATPSWIGRPQYWTFLRQFNGATDLDHADRMRLQGLINRAHYREARITSNGIDYLRRAAKIGLKPIWDDFPPYDPTMCKPILAPIALGGR